MLYILSLVLTSLLIPNQSVTVKDDSHAIYIAVVEMKHDEGQETAGVLIKVFSDDLLNCILNDSGYGDLKTEAQLCGDYEFLITSYFNKHFTLSIAGTVSTLRLNDCTQITDSHWLEFQIDCPASWDQLQIKADFFMEIYPTQSNMITIIENGTRHFYRTTKGQAEFTALLN